MISLLYRSAVILVLLIAPVHAAGEQDQNTKVRTDIAAVMDYMRTDKPHVGSLWDTVDALPPEKVLTELRRYQHDADERVRKAVLAFAYYVAKKNPGQKVARQAVELIFETATSDSSNDVTRDATDRLLKFSRSDLPSGVKDFVIQVLTTTPLQEIAPRIVDLAGVTGVSDAQAKLWELAAGNYPASRMALLALARIGNPHAVHYVVTKALGETDLQNNISNVLHDLSYIRQPEGVEGLVRFLFNDGVQKGNGSDVPDFAFASRTMSYLANVVEGFPQFVSVTEARNWVTKRGIANLKIKR